VGGYNSGRRGGRPTVGSGLTLDLCKLIRQGLIVPGQFRCGSIFWTFGGSGERVGSVDYAAHMAVDRGHVRLRYVTTHADNGQKRASDYTIAMETTPQPFGGRRWWFVCPASGQRVSKLHLPNGAYTFASRRAHRLGYPSQRESPRDRSITHAYKLRDRLNGKGGIGDYIPKPKWMRWRTYERETARIEAAAEICNAFLLQLVQRLQAKHKARFDRGIVDPPRVEVVEK
jgi:hypothetical protein